MKTLPRISPFIAIAFIAFISGCDRTATKVTETETETKPETASSPKESTPETAPSSSVKHLDADAAGNLIDENPEVIVLDIRTPQEFAEGHIQDAKNIDFKAPTFRDEIAKLDKAKSYLVHCRSGGRSTSSLPVFEELGFTGIIHLDGGFNAWKEGGNAYVKE